MLRKAILDFEPRCFRPDECVERWFDSRINVKAPCWHGIDLSSIFWNGTTALSTKCGVVARFDGMGLNELFT